MKLKVKLLEWSAGLPVAMISEYTAEHIGVDANERITIKSDGKAFTTILDTFAGNHIIKRNEIAISSEINKILKLKQGQNVEIGIAQKTKSLDFIKEKLNGKSLSQIKFNSIIKDIITNSLSEPEIALFISGMYKQGMTMKETIFLISSIMKFGEKLGLRNKNIVDKHSIGGIAGNRTTPLIVSICAATGLIMPKTSSRAITSAAGTADVIEAIAKVDFSMKELKKIIKKTNACMIWGGSLGIVPADSKIIRIEKALRIDPESQLLASIMSKKLSMGSKYILIDIPYGKNAKVSKQKALVLKRKFEYLGRYFKKKLEVVLTDGSQPIGNGIGPILELIDVIKILDPKQEGPRDLEEKSLFLSAELLELSGKAKKGKGLELAKRILDSGKAFEKFKQIIKAQKGKLKKLQPGKFHKDLLAHKNGKVRKIDNKKINFLAKLAGCPGDKLSGIYLYVHKKYRVKKGDRLLTIYAETPSRLREALKYLKIEKIITIK